MPNTNTKSHYKITMTTNTAKDVVKVQLSPKLTDSSKEDVQRLFSTLIAGTHIGLHSLLANVPVMRPATDIERDAQIYIFKNEVSDNELYKIRKQLYNDLSEVFNSILRDLFPDVEYIQMTINHQQEIVYEMTPEEAEAHRKSLEEIAVKVRTMLDEPGDTAGDMKNTANSKVVPFPKKE